MGLVLTRQGVPTLDVPAGSVARGGYVIRDGHDVTLVATGSEVATCLEAADILAGDEIVRRLGPGKRTGRALRVHT